MSSEPIPQTTETVEIPKLPIHPSETNTSICSYKNIQFGIVIICYSAFTLYSFLKFQLKWEHTAPYDLAISFIIGLLLRVAYNLKGDLESIRDILSHEQASEFEKIFQLSSRLEGIVNSTILHRSEAVSEEAAPVEEEQLTTREIQVKDRKFCIQIPKRK